ncbi:hypothetical protein F5X98DRAFT_383434 [Xylaria grammica]|nr:hypothetical protein F5X98DRAFT_383434 [Xylaria grammica]
MFSFGIVCVFAVEILVIFAVVEEELGEEEVVEAHVIERQIPYADEAELYAFYDYIGDSSWIQALHVLAAGINKSNPRRPVSE